MLNRDPYIFKLMINYIQSQGRIADLDSDTHYRLDAEL